MLTLKKKGRMPRPVGRPGSFPYPWDELENDFGDCKGDENRASSSSRT